MLTNLHVKNFALIEEADINFGKGLNILSGETGAGKSIVLGSINIALGAKVSADIIRHGCEYALAELVFHIDDRNRIEGIKELGIEDIDDGDIIIQRKITANRSQIKVNGMNCTASQVKQIAGLLIDIHGQHDNTLLLKDKAHLDMVDEYGGAAISECKAEYTLVYREYRELLNKLSEYDIDEAARQREISLTEYEVNEISAAKLVAGEDYELEALFRRMNNQQKIMADVSQAAMCLSDGRDNASDMLSMALKSLISAGAYDDGLSNVIDSLSTACDIVGDAARTISDYAESCSFDQSEYDETEKRLDMINSFKIKYGKTIELINEYGIKQQKKLDELYNLDSIITELKGKIASKKTELEEKAGELTKLRRILAKSLCEAVSMGLCELNFLNSEFDAVFETLDECTANGRDTMYFVISTNVGESLKPLSKVASGGELSRVMLAVKTVMADKDYTDTLIFDEIDAGISGKTAQLVGEKLKQLSDEYQIICITHLPQIAAMSDIHFLIEKSVHDSSTVTTIEELNEEETIDELARLLGGSCMTKAVKDNAEELRKQAKNLH